ncbi:hypothetical protein RB628_38410 [Streptomyces sp. ADMS]|uniref:hypothetical protein n=1 Tax=Streptomyces sp. ADMS TaxID=3071415 RepID=UPI00296FA76D|nr:hypothetical protein [Streptomyces sp. ADMS]MDW4911033.1 hypothetical protein [Streptomyces sp. ADMS]
MESVADGLEFDFLAFQGPLVEERVAAVLDALAHDRRQGVRRQGIGLGGGAGE